MRKLLGILLLLCHCVRAEQVVFTEVMYNPPPGKPEFIEVQNITSTPLDVANWRFVDGIALAFPDFNSGAPQSHFLQANERVIVSSVDAAAMRAAYPSLPANVRVFGPWSGALDNNGETITLQDKNGVTICQLDYGDGGRWPKAADGAGHSMTLRNENNAIDDPRNWRQSRYTGGTPGYSEFTAVEPFAGNPETGAGAAAVVFDYNTTWKFFAPGGTDPGIAWRGLGFDDSGWGSGPGLLGFETSALPQPGLQTPVGAVNGGMVYLFRKTFTYNGNPNGVGFSIDNIIDDGVYYYLNGQPMGGVRYTPAQWDGAATLVENAIEEQNAVTGAATGLVNGVNLITAEVHQNQPGSSDIVFGARLKLVSPSSITINEVRPGAAGVGFVEFFNTTAAPIDLNGYYLSDSVSNLTKHQITTSLVVAANSYATVGFSESSLAVNGGVTTVYLTRPDGTTIVNGMSATIPLDGRSLGRNPAGSSTWFFFAFPTPGTPNGTVTDEGFSLRLNEAHFDGAGNIDWVELQNTASSPVGVAGLWLSARNDFADKIPLSGNVGANGYASWATNFASDNGDVTIYLIDLNHNVLGVAELERVAGRDSMQAIYPTPVAVKPAWQYINEQPWWYSSPTDTRDALNAPPIESTIVINEIMPDPPSDHLNGEFIELYNSGAVPISLTGWRLRGGVDFDFPPGTSIPSGGYLVVGGDRDYLAATYPSATVVGNWQGTLGNRGDLLRVIDQFGNLADEVDYRVGGDWPDLAAGLGSSIELVHPGMDNSRASAWRESDESAKTAFQTYTITGNWQQLNPSGGTTDYKELHLFLVGDSHVALKNFNLRLTSGGANLIPNNGTVIATDGTSSAGWLCQGTHAASFMQGADLHLVADGHGDNRPNRAEIDVTGMSPGLNYTLTFDARWVSGKNRLIVQTWDHSFGAPLLLPIPNDLGTAGAANSRLLSSPPPQVDSVLHSPAVPRATDPVKVTARVTSALPLSSVQCIHRIDDINNAGTWVNSPMVDDGTGGDAVAGDGLFTATVTSHQVNNRIVQFYVRATAQGGATHDLPKLGALRPAAWIVDNRIMPSNLRTQRFVVPLYERDVFQTGSDAPTAKYGFRYPRLSNHYVNSTFIHNERDVYYNAEIRKSGSPWTRSTGPDLSRGKWKIARDRIFRGREKSTFDNDAENSASIHRNRITRYWLYLLGHPVNENEFVYNIINADGAALREDTEPVDGELVARVFPEGGKGQLFRSDDEWWFTDSWSRTNRNADWSYKSTDATLRYHSEWMMRSREAEYDHSALIDFFRNVNNIPGYNPADYQERLTRMIDPEMTLMMAAVRGYIHDWDSLTLDRGKNGYFYRKPTDGRFIFLHWDSDLAFDNASAPVVGSLAGWATFVNRPWTRRIFNYYLTEMLELTSGPNGARTIAWLDAEEASSSAYAVNKASYQSWFTTRRTIIENEINLGVAGGPSGAYSATFGVTTPSGNTSGAMVNLVGTAPSSAFRLVVDGHPEAVFSWTNQTAWSLSNILLREGVNTLTIRMLDQLGNQIGNPIVYSYTKTGNALPVLRLGANPGSFNVAIGEPFTLDASGSFDPEGTPLTYTWTLPNSGVVLSSPFPYRQTGIFTAPGRYVFTVEGRDADQQVASLTREITVFNSADFESFGNTVIAPFWTLQNLKVRDSFAPSAWYSLEDQEGRLLLQVLDNIAKPLVFNNPTFPALFRSVPEAEDFLLQTDLEYHAKKTGNHYAGLQLETLESGVLTRYTFGVENGSFLVVKRGTATAAFTNVGGSFAFTGTGAILRIRRGGNQLFFERRTNDTWVVVQTVTLPAGATAVRGGPFVATAGAENLRIAFDYVLLADPGNISTPLANLRITEMMYAPKAPGTVEFIELCNVGAAPINLQNCRFVDGNPFDEFVFPNLTLNAGEFAVVTNSTSAFQAKYGMGARIAGEWGTTSGLNNGGEDVVFEDADGNEIHRFAYSNTPPWPAAANGGGASLEVVNTSGNYNLASNWRASFESGGTPGFDGVGPDSDQDGQPDSHEALFGTDANDPNSRFAAVVVSNASDNEISFPVVVGRQYRVEYCSELAAGDWQTLQTVTGTAAGMMMVTDPTIPKPMRRFYRVVAL